MENYQIYGMELVNVIKSPINIIYIIILFIIASMSSGFIYSYIKDKFPSLNSSYLLQLLLILVLIIIAYIIDKCCIYMSFIT